MISKTQLRDSQAYKLLMRFGSFTEAHKALVGVGCKVCIESLYLWTYPGPRGCGGIIPSNRILDVARAARKIGIILSHEDLSPIQGQDFSFRALGGERRVSVAQRDRLRYDSEKFYKETYDYRHNLRKQKRLSGKIKDDMKGFSQEEKLNALKNFRFNEADGSYKLVPTPPTRGRRKKSRRRKKQKIEDLF